ncbi:MAG: hypothetical protein HYV13_03960 [Candidatus Doudnabacteria bacterium]|nr:hypothetical protein [Candidatus Doudnabacteria bacterium]
MAKSKPRKSAQHLIRLGKASLAVVLPPSLVRALGWKERQRVLVKRASHGLVVRDAITKKRK